MSRQMLVTVLYRESGSGCDEIPYRSGGGGIPPENAGYNAFEFRLVRHTFVLPLEENLAAFSFAPALL